MDENIIAVKKVIARRSGFVRPKMRKPLFLAERTGGQSHEKRGKYDKRHYSAAL